MYDSYHLSELGVSEVDVVAWRVPGYSALFYSCDALPNMGNCELVEAGRVAARLRLRGIKVNVVDSDEKLDAVRQRFVKYDSAEDFIKLQRSCTDRLTLEEIAIVGLD